MIEGHPWEGVTSLLLALAFHCDVAHYLHANCQGWGPCKQELNLSLFMLIFMVTNDCKIVRWYFMHMLPPPPPHDINKIAEDPQVCQKDIQTLARKAGQ
jgi:hypothetical protein